MKKCKHEWVQHMCDCDWCEGHDVDECLKCGETRNHKNGNS